MKRLLFAGESPLSESTRHKQFYDSVDLIQLSLHVTRAFLYTFLSLLHDYGGHEHKTTIFLDTVL